MFHLKFILISIIVMVLLQPIQVHARLQIKGRSNSKATNTFIPNDDRLLKNNDDKSKNGSEKDTSSSPPPPPPPSPPSSDTDIKKPTSAPIKTPGNNNKPSSSSSKDSMSFPFQQFYLTFQTTSSSGDDTSSSLDDIEESKILQVTKRHIDDYFYNMFKVVNIVISVRKITKSNRRLRRQQQYDPLYRRMEDTNEATYTISGSIQFQNDSAPTANLMEVISLQLFDDRYILMLEKKGITTDSLKASVSFTNPNESKIDKGVVDGATTGDGSSNNNNLETIGGGGSNRGGIIGGVLGSFAILCMASLLFVKMKRDNKQGDDQDNSNRGGHSLLTSQIFERTLRGFNFVSRHNGESSDEEDNRMTGHDHGPKHKYRRTHRGGLRNHATKTHMAKNTDVMTNDDGSVFETVYSIQGGHAPPLSPSLKLCFSISPRRMTSHGINSHNGKGRGNDIVSVVGADDTYSLNGSFAIDDGKPNMGDEMLDHVLSMNDYDSNIIVIDPDSFNGVKSQKSGDELISNHDLENNNDALNDSAEISEADISTFSFSNHFSDAPSGQKKRQTIRDLRIAASKRYFSPEKNHIIFERTATSPGIDIVRVSPEKQKPISIVGKATSDIGSLMDVNDSDTSHDSNQFSAVGEDILDNDSQSPAQFAATANTQEHVNHQSSHYEGMEEPLKISSRIMETEFTEANIWPNPQTDTFEAVEIGPNPLTRTNTSNFVKNRKFKITVETSAPPPPKTPERYPFQDLNRGKKVNNSQRVMSTHNYSESDSSDDEDDECYSGDESTFTEYTSYPIQSQRSKENHVPTNTSTSKGQEVHHGNTTHLNSLQQNIIKPKYTRRITSRREKYPIVDAADARNARRKRLTKSMERNTKSILNFSKAEKAANLRKMRLQTQKLALSPTQVKKKMERDTMIGRREV